MILQYLRIYTPTLFLCEIRHKVYAVRLLFTGRLGTCHPTYLKYTQSSRVACVWLHATTLNGTILKIYVVSSGKHYSCSNLDTVQLSGQNTTCIYREVWSVEFDCQLSGPYSGVSCRHHLLSGPFTGQLSHSLIH